MAQNVSPFSAVPLTVLSGKNQPPTYSEIKAHMDHATADPMVKLSLGFASVVGEKVARPMATPRHISNKWIPMQVTTPAKTAFQQCE